jgi:hypothetical protein
VIHASETSRNFLHLVTDGNVCVAQQLYLPACQYRSHQINRYDRSNGDESKQEDIKLPDRIAVEESLSVKDVSGRE